LPKIINSGWIRLRIRKQKGNEQNTAGLNETHRCEAKKATEHAWFSEFIARMYLSFVVSWSFFFLFYQTGEGKGRKVKVEVKVNVKGKR
jgi:hypothetical protein